MQPTRRDFLKLTTLGGAAAAVFGFDLQPAYAELRQLKIARANETRSTCPYCSVSCGVIIYTIGDRAKNVTPQVVHVEGDPDHPINRCTLCPKGASLEQDIMNDRRIIKPQVRRPGRRRGTPDRSPTAPWTANRGWKGTATRAFQAIAAASAVPSR